MTIVTLNFYLWPPESIGAILSNIWIMSNENMLMALIWIMFTRSFPYIFLYMLIVILASDLFLPPKLSIEDVEILLLSSFVEFHTAVAEK